MTNWKSFVSNLTNFVPVNHGDDNGRHSIRQTSCEMLEVLARIAELRDEQSGNHIFRVGLYSSVLAKAIGLPFTLTTAIGLGGMLHDIGNVGIPDTILFTDGQTSPSNYETKKLHTIIGGRVLEGMRNRVMRVAASIALTHHEHWDGSGYPNGLRGDSIPIEGRIVMLADCYDSLRSRQDRKMNHAIACKSIIEGSKWTDADHFDPLVVNTFLKVNSSFAEIFEGSSNISSTDDTYGNVKRLLQWHTCNI